MKSNLPFDSDGVQENAFTEASLNEYKGVNQTFLVLFWKHVLELEEEIAKLVLEWHLASYVIVSKTELAQDAWVAYIH